MKTLFAYLTSVLVVMMLANSAHAKNVIKRIEPEVATTNSVAMALETYDGSFHDLSDFKKVKKSRGNISQIMRKGVITLNNGQEVDANSIRYFFVQKPESRRMVPGKIPSTWKAPRDED